MAKRKIPYGKIVDGFGHCFGAFGRNCEDCPYEDYKEEDDPFGDAPAWCHDKLLKDLKRWSDELAGFAHCEDCCCWHKNYDEDGIYHFEWEGKQGQCSTWNTVMYAEEFCSRGARNE